MCPGGSFQLMTADILFSQLVSLCSWKKRPALVFILIMPSTPKKNAILAAIAMVCFVLFFVGGPDYYSSRSFKNFWDLGHILFFAILTYLILANWPERLKTTFFRQSLIAVALAIALGSMVELAQTASFRTTDLMDVARDTIGCLVALAFLVPAREKMSKTARRILQTTTVILVAMAVSPLAIAIMDEAAARNQFPVLADFETPFETGRWSGNADFLIDHNIHFHGKAALKVTLNTAQYSGVALKYFPGNWQGYDALQLSIYNPDPQPLRLTCRIHDHRHTLGAQRYEDRFNKAYRVAPGWNLIRIPLAQVENAPQKRKMALNQIQGLGIFAVSLPKSRTVFLDYIRLE